MDHRLLLRMFYMTEEEWATVESNLIGNHGDEVITFYDGVYSLMSSIWNKTRSPKQIVLSTAMVYFHKYFITIKKIDNDIEKIKTCIACLFLATKSCNHLISLEELVKCPHVVAQYDDPIEEIFQIEFNILSVLGFDLEVDLPYKYLIDIKTFFDSHLNLNTKKLTELCCFYINDSFTLPLCLFYSPPTIALACVFLLFQQFKFGIAIDTIIEEMNIGQTVHLRDVVHCAEMMARIYIKDNAENSNNGHNTTDNNTTKNTDTITENSQSNGESPIVNQEILIYNQDS